MQSDAPRDGRALRDVAKLAAPTRGVQVPNADSSGLVDLGALMAEQPNWLDDALARAKTNARARTYDSVSQISLAPTARETTPEETQAAGVPRRRLLPLVLGITGGAALLVAVASVVALRGHAPPVAAAPKAIAAAAHVDEPIPPPPAADVAAPVTPNDPPAPVAVAPPAPEKEPPAPRRGRHAARDSARASSFVAKTASPRAAAAPRTPATPAAPVAPAPKTSALESALRAAAGPTAPPPPADASPAPAAKTATAPAGGDGRPDRPSGSAVTSALTQVLPAARACLASGAEPSRATITFRPDGAVQKVDVTGSAAADAKASACIRGAFGGAKVPPFSQSAYTASATVRAR